MTDSEAGGNETLELGVCRVTAIKPKMGWITHVDDFETEFLRTCSPTDKVLEDVVPCAVSVHEEYLLCVDYRCTSTLLQSPFLYKELRENAKLAVKIPFSRLAEVSASHWGGTQQRPSPLFIFSIGRCGTTLLCKLLSAYDAAVLSEPDAYTHAAMMLGGLDGETRERSVSQALGFATRGLLSKCNGKQGVIKFRSQVNSIAALLMKVNPDARGFMLLREPIAWAESIYRAFDWDPESTATHYCEALTAAYQCRAVGRPLTTIWYDGIRSNPIMILRSMLKTLQTDAATSHIEVIDEILRHDAQHDTMLARESLTQHNVPDHFLTEFRTHLKTMLEETEASGIDLVL